MRWHIANSNDAAIRWLVEQIGMAAGAKAGADETVVSFDRSKRSADG